MVTAGRIELELHAPIVLAEPSAGHCLAAPTPIDGREVTTAIGRAKSNGTVLLACIQAQQATDRVPGSEAPVRDDLTETVDPQVIHCRRRDF